MPSWKKLIVSGSDAALNSLSVTTSVTANSFVKLGGTSSQFLKADGSVDSTVYQPLLTNPVTGTGTTNYVTKFTGTGTVGNSQIFDNGTIASGIDFFGTLNFYLGGTTNVIKGKATNNTLVLSGGNTTADGGNIALGGSTGTNNIQFRVGTSVRYYTDSTGFNGINTNAPTNTLDVNGTARIRSGAYIASDSGNVILGGLVDTGLAKLQVNGDATITNALISNQENLDVDSAAAEVVAQVSSTTYTSVFFDYSIKNGTNVRAGTVYATHDGTNVVYTETSTADLGDTSGVELSVDLNGGNLRLLATVTTDNWSIKSLIRGL